MSQSTNWPDTIRITNEQTICHLPATACRTVAICDHNVSLFEYCVKCYQGQSQQYSRTQQSVIKEVQRIYKQ